jgi:hypothetical protein
LALSWWAWRFDCSKLYRSITTTPRAVIYFILSKYHREYSLNSPLCIWNDDPYQFPEGFVHQYGDKNYPVHAPHHGKNAPINFMDRITQNVPHPGMQKSKSSKD